MIRFRDKVSGLRALWHFDNRCQLILNRLLFPRSGPDIYRIRDLEFLVDHRGQDHNGTRLCLISDIYARFLPKMNLGKSISVFDLGANGGGFPLMLLLHGIEIAKLVCVEINPNTFRRLQYNIGRNVKGETALVHAAVCGHPRELHLSLGGGDISDSIYPENQPATKKRQTYAIAGRTFDDLFESTFGDSVVDICKMDIEGAEYEVLGAAGHEKLSRCRYLIMELHVAPPGQVEHVTEELTALGFRQIKIGEDPIPSERLYRNTKRVSV